MVAASAGNHAQGVALAASLVGATAKVYMPVGASIAKLTATRAYGADVDLVGESLDDALDAATAYAARTGAVLVHPFDHPGRAPRAGHGRPGDPRAGAGRDTADQAATAGGDHHGGDVGHLLEDLQADGALPAQTSGWSNGCTSTAPVARGERARRARARRRSVSPTRSTSAP